MHQFRPNSDLTPFPQAKLAALLSDLERLRPAGRAVAAFDADGTLWNGDMGEGFFDFKIRNKLVPLPADPWGHYNYLKDHVSHTEAYVWLAQILRGVPLSQVHAWAAKAVAERPPLVFPEMVQVMNKLRELDVEIFVVTASIKWAVEPAVKVFGLGFDNVIGIETAVVDGNVTEKPKGIITYREGKADAILARTGGVKPYFCAGNTEGDKWLLEAASAMCLVISSAPENTENFPTEAKMLALAAAKGWHSHRY